MNMNEKTVIYVVLLIAFTDAMLNVTISSNSKLSDKDDGKSSLIFVFDTTGSMHNDLRQLIEGAEKILDTALEESDVITDFVFVPFHDPAVGPATVTRDKEVFKSALNIVRVYGGGDCPEKSLGGIQLALNVSRPHSYIYVFTDATASDHRLVGKVLDAVQRKQTQVVFVLTGHCNDLHKPSYKVYQQIAAASSGQVFNLNKNNVHKVLDFVRSSLKGRTVNLGSAVNPAGYNYTQGIPVDSTLGEVTVSVSGAKPKIRVVSPSGEELTGPPKLVTTLDLSEIMVVKVLQPEPGNWTITTGSEEDYSVKVVGLSNVTFNHGFSVATPASMEETSYRPLHGAYNHMMISLTQTDIPININYAEIQSLNGKTIFEIPLKEIDRARKIYLSGPFLPPDDFFYIAINGRDEHNQELKRIGATAVQAKTPDVPYLTVSQKVEARSHERVVLSCKVESLVPVTVMWTKNTMRIQEMVSSLQSTSVEYVIEDMTEDKTGNYRCVARNVAGISQALTEVYMLVAPPQLTISPESRTVQIGDNITVSCTAVSEVVLMQFELYHNGIHIDRAQAVHESAGGNYVMKYKEIQRLNESDGGVYSCVAVNRGGQSALSTNITVQSEPIAQILGPHTLIRLIHADIQLVCHVEYANRLVWVAPNGTAVKEVHVTASYTDLFDVRNVTDDGAWTCMAFRGSRKVIDSIQIIVQIKPEVRIEGTRNITILNGTSVQITCVIRAKPEPRILWHRETERFFNNTITLLEPNVYKSVLTLDSAREAINGTYFCFGENAEGIDHDSVVVGVRRAMTLVEGFTDKRTELYSQVDLHCQVDAHPPAKVTWYHNGTRLNTTDNFHIGLDGTLYVQKLNFDDLGAYMCEADNGFEKMKVEGSMSVSNLENPVLDKEATRIITHMGNSALITCRVTKGNPEPTINWQYRSRGSEELSGLSHNVLFSEDRVVLSIPAVGISDAGVYRCVAGNVVGIDVYDVELVVEYPPQLAQGTNQTDTPIEIEGGQQITFSCKAIGVPPPIVVWTKNERPVTYSSNVYLSEDSDLVIEKASEHDSGLYTCKATNVLGALQRNFTLVVYVPPIITPPEFLPQLEVLEGELVELPCSARGVPTPQVEWLQNDMVISERRKHIDGFGLRFVANLTDFGEYTCIAKNRYGNATFNFSVYIWVAPYIAPPVESTADVLLGTNITLECNAVGFPVPSIVWAFKSKDLVENTTDRSFTDNGYVFIKNASIEHEGLYVCMAENIAGVAIKSTYLNVNEPPQILQENYTGAYIATDKDQELAVSCKTTGNPDPYIVWSKDGFYLDTDSRYDIDVDGTLVIKAPTEALSGQYTCTAINVHGRVNMTKKVEIYSMASRMQAEQSHTTVTILEGTNASIECPARVSHTDVVKWYKDAKLISVGNLHISNVSRLNTSSYACVATTALGPAYSALDVNVAWPPRFAKEAKETVEVVRGEDWYLDCGVDAKPAAKVKWLFNSKLMLGEDKNRLKLMNIQVQHAGIYKCVVNNIHGTVARHFTLDVLVPSFISEFDVLDVQLKKGANATLECNARGSPQPEVRWTYNNTNWLLKNRTLTTTNVTTKSEGIYRCDATNRAGRSRLVYRVSVVEGARVEGMVVYRGGVGETAVGGVEVELGARIRLSCSASGNPSPTIQWIKNGNVMSQNLPEIIYTDLLLDGVEAEHGGLYSCVAANEGGMDEKRIKLDVLEPPRISQNLFQNSNTSETTRKLEVISGQPFFLHCHPYGNPTPELYWFREGITLRLFDESMVSKDYGETIVVKSAMYEQSGNYTCVARNKVGETSVVYLVDVLVPPPIPKESSKSISIRLGRRLNLTCPVEGSPPPYASWVKHPYTEISGDMPRVELVNDNYTLLINSTQVQDSGKYSCIMTNKVGTTEIVFDVTIEKPPSIAGNVGGDIGESRVVSLRRSIVLKCQADGNPPPKISWLKDTQRLRDDLPNIQHVLGSSLLAVWDAGPRDAGQYVCVAESAAGTAHRRYYIAVQVPGKWSAWSQWSLCNASCGLGYQQRARSCHYTDDYNVTYDKTTKSDKIVLDDSACKGLINERRKCHMPPCEDEDGQRWSVWSKWSPCSATCGIGTQARTRRCKARGRCAGDNVQIKKCPDLPKCKSKKETENEVFNSKEEDLETSVFLPEATFEIQPEVVNSPYTSYVEESYIRPEQKYSTTYYDVNVTENFDGISTGPCEPGYRHNHSTQSCDDIDECLIDVNQCHSTQVCVNTAGAYRCTCPKGFTSLGVGQRCLDINECEQDIHGCEFACVNVAGGYVCACPSHLRLHADRHRCVTPPSYRKPYSHEDEGYEDYLSATIDFPAKYTKYTRN